MVRVDPWTGWSSWRTVEDWYDLMAYDSQWERDQKIRDEYIVWAFQDGIADGELMRHWLDKIGAIVDGLGNWVGEAASMVFVGCIHPLIAGQ